MACRPPFIMLQRCLTPLFCRSRRQKRRKIDLFERRNSGLQDASFTLYRSFQILNNAYNGCFAAAIAWTFATLMNDLVLSLIITIRVVPKTMPPTNLHSSVGFIALLIALRYVVMPLADFANAPQQSSVQVTARPGVRTRP